MSNCQISDESRRQLIHELVNYAKITKKELSTSEDIPAGVEIQTLKSHIPVPLNTLHLLI